MGSEQHQAQPLAPGFLVVHANQPEQLRALIVQWLRAYPLDVFETETVLVQSNGIAQWLKLALAADVDESSMLLGGLGIASGLSLQMPGRFIWQLYRWVMPDAEIPETSVFDKDRLRWRLLRLLPTLCLKPEFKALAQYLQHDVDSKKADQLALKLADLFDQYQVYRADWLQDWACGRLQIKDANGLAKQLPEEQRWQALLWQAVLADLSGAGAEFSRAQLHQDFLQQAATFNQSKRPLQLPRRVILFGISSLPQQTLEALAAIAPYTQILLAVHNPCQHYWADIIADKDLFRAQQQRQPYKLAVAPLSSTDSHPLLAAWGKQGRDYIRLLDQFDQTTVHKSLFVGERIDLFTAPDTGFLLGQLQHDIFDLTVGGQWPPVAEQDHSLCFAKAHSVIREVEILHDDILQLLAGDPKLSFSDFMVMVPDINDYAAAIHAVFGRINRDDSRYIPYTIADQAALQQEPMLQALQYLLNVRQQRFGISEILDLLQVPAVAARFELDAGALVTLTGWLEQANVRWGLHAEQRASLGISVQYNNHSLFAGLSRMLAGYALGDAEPWLEVAPLTDVSGLSAEIAGQFAKVCQQLELCWLDSSALQLPEQWQQRLVAWLDLWFEPSDEQELALLQRLKKALSDWLKCCNDADFAEPLPLSVVASAWLDGFNEQSLQQKFLAGAVNFATLMPMRAIPFAHIQLLGMQDGAFPRQSRRQDFDLMGQSYRPGDRARRDDDRYLFLEALLSARKRLRISWIGHSIHDNSEREPSVLIAQLRDHLQQYWRHASSDNLLAALTLTHPLQAFSKRYLQDAKLRSYQHEWRTLHNPLQVIAPEESVGVAEAALRQWDLRQLTDFVREPIKFFFRQRLKVSLQTLDETSPDAEDFSQDKLTQWQIQQQLSEGVMKVLRDGGNATEFLQQSLHRLQLEDRLAFGAAGAIQAEAYLGAIMPQLKHYQAALAQTKALADDGLCYLAFDRISDWFSGVRIDASEQAIQLHWSLAALKKDKMWQLKALLKPWLAVQLSCAADKPITQWIVAQDGLLKLPLVAATDAQQRLTSLLAYAVKATAEPLPIEVNLAGLWLQLAGDDSKKLAKLQSRYDGDGFNSGLVDYDPYLARAFATFDSLWQQADASNLPAAFYKAVLHDVNSGSLSMQTLDLLKLPLAGSALIEASAGTGKTYTIAALYLRLVLGHPQAVPLLPPQILVVTFTEAATSELKGRIRARLADAARFFLEPSSHADSFLQQLAAEFPKEQWPSCAQQLALAAQWMDDAAISTIHGWCNRMLTEHAFDSGAAFDLQLNTDLSDLKLQVVEDYWRSFIYPLSLAHYRLLQQKVSDPAQLLQCLLPLWNQPVEAFDTLPAQLLQAEIVDKQTALSAIKQPFSDWIDELEQLIEAGRAAGLTVNTKLRADYVSRWLTALRLWRDTPELEMPDLGSGLQRLTPTGIADAWKGQAPEHPILIAIANLPEVIAALPDAMQGIRKHAIAWCLHRFTAQKNQLGLMGFDDLLSGLQQALQQPNGDVLAERIRQQFPFALIDEFQDTDPIQFSIFDRIYQLAAQRTDSGILLIGDPKQAIYGFRGADIYTYLEAKAKTQGHHYGLDTNFRSTQAMVQAVNAMFSKAEQRPSGRGAFLFRGAQTDLSFVPVHAKGRPEVLKWPAQLPALAVRYLEGDDKPLAKASYLTQMAGVCAAEISLLLQAGQLNTCGFSKDNQLVGVLPRDIAVLVNNQQEADAIRKALAQYQIRSVYLSDKGSVFESPMAHDLWLWLDACAEPRNQLKVRSALASASLRWSYSMLARLQDDEWFMEQQLDLFLQYHALWQKSGVLPLVRRLMSDFQVAEHLAQYPDAERRLTDLLHLAALLQQASRLLDGERALLRYFAQQRSGVGLVEVDSVKLQLESDEALVRVVTIHKSKGLEYPLVFLPFICAAREVDAKKLPYRFYENGRYQLAHVSDERTFKLATEQRLAEDLRKLYVAMTRAQHYCWLGLAPQKELSAIGYLIADEGELDPAQIGTQLELWLSTTDWPEVDLKPANLALSAANFVDLTSSQQLADYAVMPSRQRVPWWTASYSAIASGVENAEHKGGELYQELSAEQREWTEPVTAPDFSEDFIRGADAGTLLHGELEWAGEQGFANIAQAPEQWRAHLVETLIALNLLSESKDGWQRRFLRSEAGQSPYFESAEAAVAPMWQWLVSLLSVPLLPDQTALSGLTQTKVELEFWISADKVSTKQLDALLSKYMWPGLTRPELDARLVNGMLKGFIDLSFMQNGQYYVADYKSNFLASGRYTDHELIEVMLAKRYDLQAACYGLAMHRLLKSRKADYQPALHLGPAVYWFLRGSAKANHGVLRVDLPIALISALDDMFKGIAVVPQQVEAI